MTKQRVFFLTRLKEGVDPDDYEAWVRRVDYPIARNEDAITSYVVTRLEGQIDGSDAPYDYIEVIDITTIGEYRDLDSDDFKRLLSEFFDHIGEVTAVWGTVISD